MFLVVQDRIIINHMLREFKGYLHKDCSMFCAIIYYQFTTSELKNVEKLVKQTVKALKSY